MNEMRKLMEAVADLDFESPVEPLPEKGDWEAIWRDCFGENQLIHQGTYEECVRAAKLSIKSHLDVIQGDVLIQKKDNADGGLTYEMDAVDEDWNAWVHIQKVRRFY
jgi:hypothetical protein